MEKNTMVNDLEKFEKSQIEKLTSKTRIPAFSSGDAIKVTGIYHANDHYGNFTVKKLS